MCTKCNREHLQGRHTQRWLRSMNNTPYTDVQSYPVRCDDINCDTKKIRRLSQCNCCKLQFCKKCTARHWNNRIMGRDRSPYGYSPKKRVPVRMTKLV